MPATPTVQGHSWLLSEFETSLSSNRKQKMAGGGGREVVSLAQSNPKDLRQSRLRAGLTVSHSGGAVMLAEALWGGAQSPVVHSTQQSRSPPDSVFKAGAIMLYF